MQLEFEITQQICAGNNPSGVHFEDEAAQVFYTGEDGTFCMRGALTTPFDEWADRSFSNSAVMGPDMNMRHLTLRYILGFNLYGSFYSNDNHRFIMYRDKRIADLIGYVHML